MPDVTIDDNDNAFQYMGSGWRTEQDEKVNATREGYVGGTYHTTCKNADTVTFSWEGTGVVLYHQAKSHKGFYSILLDTLDPSQKVYFDGFSSQPIIPAVMFNVTDLPLGNHTVVMTNEKDYNKDRYGCNGIDYATLLGVPETATHTFIPAGPTFIRNGTLNSTSSVSGMSGTPSATSSTPSTSISLITIPPTTALATTNTPTQIGGAATSLQGSGTPRVSASASSIAPIAEPSSGADWRVSGSGLTDGVLGGFVLLFWTWRMVFF